MKPLSSTAPSSQKPSASRLSLWKFGVLAALTTGLVSCGWGAPAPTPAPKSAEVPPAEITQLTDQGFRGYYSDSRDLKGSVIPSGVLATSAFQWDLTASPILDHSKQLNGHWASELVPDQSGEYQFFASSAHPVSLSVDGQDVTAGQAVTLEKGKRYWIQLNAQTIDPVGSLSLEWQSQDLIRQLIPTRLLSTQPRNQTLHTQGLSLGQNIVPNSGFEDGLTGFYSYATPASVTSIVSPGSSSTKALSIISTPNYWQNDVRFYDFTPDDSVLGAKYRFEVDIKTIGAAACRIAGNSSGPAPDLFINTTADTNFTTVSRDIIVPSSTGELGYVFWNQSSAYSKSGTCIFDNFRISMIQAPEIAPDPFRNLIKNGGVEKAPVTPGEPADWTKISGGAFIRSPGVATSAFAFGSDSTATSTYQQSIPISQIKVNSDYVLKAFIKGKRYYCTVSVDTGNGVISSQPQNETGWTEISAKINIINPSPNILVQVSGSQGCAIDNVRFGPVNDDGIGPKDPQPNPTPDPVSDPTASVSLSTPVTGIGSPSSFDASDFNAKTYTWAFDDGGSSTDATVSHLFTTPGKHTATLTMLLYNGQSLTKTVAVGVLPEIDKIVSQRATNDSMTVHFDAGPPIDGVGYKFELSDGTVETHSQFDHTYTKIGTYDYTLTATDLKAPLTGQSVTGRLTAQALTPPVIYQQHSWHTLWRRAPVAVAKVTSAATQPIVFGRPPFTVSFDASQSTNPNTNKDGAPLAPLTYTWVFGDGSQGSGAQVSHTFGAAGLFPVVLTVQNEFGLSSTSTTLIHVRESYSNFKMNVTQGDAFAPGVLTLDQPSPLLSAQDLGHNIIDYFPYVLPNNNEVTGASFATLGPTGDVINSFCNQMQFQVYNKATPLANLVPVPELGADAAGNPYFCSKILAARGIIGRVPAVLLSNVTAYASSYLNDMRFAVFDRLAVPKVSIIVVPDEFVGGESASPQLIEYSAAPIVAGGKSNWLLQVYIRSSEIKNGTVDLKIPVMAVDRTDAFIPNITGRFKATFVSTAFTSNCGDCTMVNGRAYINVTLPVNGFDDGQAALDLSTIRLDTDNACGSTDMFATAGNFRLVGCSNVKTTSELPSRRLVAIPKYEYEPYARFGNHIYYGPGAPERVAYYKSIAGAVSKSMRFGITVLAPEVLIKEKWNNYLDFAAEKINDGDIHIEDNVKFGLMGADLTFGSVPAFIPSVRSLIAQGIGDFDGIAQAEQQFAKDSIAAKESANQFAQKMYNNMGQTAIAAKQCGGGCAFELEMLLKRLYESRQALQKDVISRFEKNFNGEVKADTLAKRFDNSAFKTLAEVYRADGVVLTDAQLQDLTKIYADILSGALIEGRSLTIIQKDGKLYRGISGAGDSIDIPASLKDFYSKACLIKGDLANGTGDPKNGTCGEVKAITRMLNDGYSLSKESLGGARSISITVRTRVNNPKHGLLIPACTNNCTPVLNDLGIIDTYNPVP